MFWIEGINKGSNKKFWDDGFFFRLFPKSYEINSEKKYLNCCNCLKLNWPGLFIQTIN